MPTKTRESAPAEILTASLQTTRDKAHAFASENAKTLASELIAWQDTGLLPDGQLKALRAIWEEADEPNAMSLAKFTATRAVLDAFTQERVPFAWEVTQHGKTVLLTAQEFTAKSCDGATFKPLYAD